MDQLVAHGHDLSPGNRGIGIAHGLRNPCGGFSNQFDIAQHSILDKAIGLELILAEISSVADGPGGKFLHVIQVEQPVPLGAPLRR